MIGAIVVGLEDQREGLRWWLSGVETTTIKTPNLDFDGNSGSASSPVDGVWQWVIICYIDQA
jgi:hypothetical protein